MRSARLNGSNHRSRQGEPVAPLDVAGLSCLLSFLRIPGLPRALSGGLHLSRNPSRLEVAEARLTHAGRAPTRTPEWLCRPSRSRDYEGWWWVLDSSFNLSTIPQSSASEPALIFRIMLLRWTFTVASAMPMSPAICLFNRPVAT